MAKEGGFGGSKRRRPTFERIMRILHQAHRQLYEKEGSAWSLMYREISRQAIDAYNRRAPVVWTTSYVFPMEMIAAFDLIPVDFELYAGIMSAANQTPAALRAADRISVPQDTCTIHRIAIGAVLEDQLPRPDLLLSTSHYCDGKAKTNEFMEDHYGVEYQLLDMPLDDTPAARAYLEYQLWEVFQKLADLAGRRADEELLVEPIRHFNEMTRHFKRVNEIRSGIPSPPIPENRGFFLSFLTTLLYGTRHATEVYRRLEASLSTPSAEGHVPPETLRFLWLMASPTYQNPIFSFLEKRGGRIVMEELGHCYWEEMDERTPITSIAKRMLSNTFMGPVSRRAGTAVTLARRFKVDAALHFGHLPCRQSSGALHVIKDALESQGIRLINLEADLSDPANFPEDRIIDQLETHWDILASRRKKSDTPDS